jgi:hypothetical protein
MKNIGKGLLAAALIIAIAAPAANALGAYATWWNTSGGDNGFGIGLRHRTPITPLFAIDARAAWVKFSDADFDMFPLEATGLVTLGLFYGGVGAGYYFFSGDTKIKSDFGWHILAGGELGVGPVGVFGEARWGMLSPKLDIPGEPEVDLDQLSLSAGVRLGF